VPRYKTQIKALSQFAAASSEIYISQNEEKAKEQTARIKATKSKMMKHYRRISENQS
jgi:hypothetical protein